MAGRKSRVILWREAIRDSELDRTAKLVAYTISTYMNASGEAFPSKPTIARGASLGQGLRAVDEAVRRLTDAGFLSVRRSRSLQYTLAFPDTHPGAGSNPHGGAGLKRLEHARNDIETRTDRQSNPHRGAGEIEEIEEVEEIESRSCFVCEHDYKQSSNGHRPLLVQYAGQWWCQPHYEEEAGIDVDIPF